jgi:DNA-binding transcriptional MerR regulator
MRMIDDAPLGEDEASGDSGRVRPRKTADAFRTISEVADDLHVPQHVLRFWETKFPQVRPLKRGGGRRYYRPEDVLLLRRVADLLYTQGYTIKGVQRLLREGGGELQENIPPASPEERAAAAAERDHLVAAPEAVRPAAKPAAAQLPMPGFLPPEEPPAPRIAARVVLRPKDAPLPQKPDREVARLRALLADTLAALEEMRRLLG